MLREMRRPTRPTSFPGATPMPTTPPSEGSATRGRRHPRLGGITPYLGDHRVGVRGASRTWRATWCPRWRARRGCPLRRRCSSAVSTMLRWRCSRRRTRRSASRCSKQAERGPPRRLPAPPPRFVDGGALAVTLARGDISSTVIGTVTHVDGDHLVAFGHPMMEIGEVGYPTARRARAAHPLHRAALVQDRRARRAARHAGARPTGGDRRRHVAASPDDPDPPSTHRHSRHRAQRVELRDREPSLGDSVLLTSSIQSAVKSVAGDADFVTFEATSSVRLTGERRRSSVDHGLQLDGRAPDQRAGSDPRVRSIGGRLREPVPGDAPAEVDIALALTLHHHTAEIVDATWLRPRSIPETDGIPVRVGSVP